MASRFQVLRHAWRGSTKSCQLTGCWSHHHLALLLLASWLPVRQRLGLGQQKSWASHVIVCAHVSIKQGASEQREDRPSTTAFLGWIVGIGNGRRSALT